MHNYKITESNHLRVSFAKTRTSSWTQPLLGVSFSLDITHAALVMFKSNICVILAAVVVRPQWLSAVSCKLHDTLWWRYAVTQMPASKFAVFWSDFFFIHVLWRNRRTSFLDPAYPVRFRSKLLPNSSFRQIRFHYFLPFTYFSARFFSKLSNVMSSQLTGSSLVYYPSEKRSFIAFAHSSHASLLLGDFIAFRKYFKLKIDWKWTLFIEIWINLGFVLFESRVLKQFVVVISCKGPFLHARSITWSEIRKLNAQAKNVHRPLCFPNTDRENLLLPFLNL